MKDTTIPDLIDFIEKRFEVRVQALYSGNTLLFSDLLTYDKHKYSTRKSVVSRFFSVEKMLRTFRGSGVAVENKINHNIADLLYGDGSGNENILKNILFCDIRCSSVSNINPTHEIELPKIRIIH
jgi:hypothetical protein